MYKVNCPTKSHNLYSLSASTELQAKKEATNIYVKGADLNLFQDDGILVAVKRNNRWKDVI